MVSPVGVSAIEAVAPVETAVGADAMQTPPPIRQSRRISRRQMASTANNGDEKRKTDVPPPAKARETVDDTGTIAEPSDGERDGCQGPSPAPRKFPTVEPKKRKIANLDEAKYEEGYDSDGNLPYYFDYEGDEDEDEEDDEVEDEEDHEDDVGVVLPLEVHEIKEFAGKRLKEELKKRGLSTCGKKEVLVTRLINGRNAKIGEGKKGKKKREDNFMAGLPATAMWVLLNPLATPVAEPVNLDSTLKPPTGLEGPVNEKHAYSDVFERSPFTGTDEKCVRPPESHSKANRKNTNSLGEERNNRKKRIPKPRTKGGPNTDHLTKYGLDLLSDPLDWFRSLMPLYPSDNLEDFESIDAIGDGTTMFSVSNWRAYTNTKAEMACAGHKGGEYEGRWTPLTNVDLFQMLGVMTLDGVAPATMMRRRMQPQSAERTCGNDRLAACIEPNFMVK
jgi:hypothetical protein